MKKIGICFIHYEKNEEYIENTLFFINNGIINSSNIEYTFVCNGVSTINFPLKNNIKIIRRCNDGYDFAGYGAAVIDWDLNKKKYDYYIFINNSCRGPFIPFQYKKYCNWTDVFINLIKNNTKLVGSTINEMQLNPSLAHVQSYAFCLDFEAFNYLNKKNFFTDKIYRDRKALVKEKEIGMSCEIKNNNWNISCLIPELSDIDYINLSKPINPAANLGKIKTQGDLCYPGNYCFGREIHPYEVLFIKINRKVGHDPAISITKWLNKSTLSNI